MDTADKFKQACKDYGFGPEHILPHGSYLINLASADPALLTKSYNAFVDELKRCEILGIRWTVNQATTLALFMSSFCTSSAVIVEAFFLHQRVSIHNTIRIGHGHAAL